jgi:hypothetical protein
LPTRVGQWLQKRLKRRWPRAPHTLSMLGTSAFGGL